MTQNKIMEAIEQKRVVSFSYQGHPRKVEPHVLGVSKGVIQFLGFQIAGSSKSGGKLPAWRRFVLTEMSDLRIEPEDFPGRRPFPSGIHSPWDKQILIVD